MTRLIDMIALIALARALNPAAFGLVALAMSTVYIVEAATELPLVSALVRLKDVGRSQLDTSFTLSLLRGLILAGILCLAAWPLAEFYDDRRLVALISALSIAPAARGLVNPNLALDARAIQFWRFFAIDLSGKAISALIAIATALITHSYWAIAIYTIGAPLLSSIVSFALAPYLPRLTLIAWREFTRYIAWNTAGQIIQAFNWQFDRLLLGRSLPKIQFGQYVLASDVAALPEQGLVKPIIGPLMSGFVAARELPARLRGAYLRADSAIFSAGVPIMLGLSAMAEPAMRIALGEKWAPSAPMLQWLALTLVPPLAAAPMPALAAALDRPEVVTYKVVIETFVRIPLLIAGAWFMGLYGVIYARLATDTLMSVVSMAMVERLIGLPIFSQLKDLWRSALAGGALYGTVLAMQPFLHHQSGFTLITWSAVTATAGGLVYVAVAFICWHLAGKPPGMEGDLARRLNGLLLRHRSRLQA
jgi:O-antigen/teichoic acid export membrane protein